MAPALQVGGGEVLGKGVAGAEGLPIRLGGGGADGRAVQVFGAPGVCGVRVGGVPAAQGFVFGVDLQGAGQAQGAGVLRVVVNDHRRADGAVFVDPANVGNGKADAAQRGLGAQLVELVVFQVVFVLGVVGHRVEQVRPVDAGGVLAVAGAGEQPPGIVHRGVEHAGGGVGPAAAHKGGVGPGVAARLVGRVDGGAAGGPVHAHKVGEALLHPGVKALEAGLGGQPVHKLDAGLGPGFLRVGGRLRGGLGLAPDGLGRFGARFGNRGRRGGGGRGRAAACQQQAKGEGEQENAFHGQLLLLNKQILKLQTFGGGGNISFCRVLPVYPAPGPTRKGRALDRAAASVIKSDDL